jgi:biopolymer transport protein ExbD
MSKKTILLLSFTLALAAIVIVKEIVYSTTMSEKKAKKIILPERSTFPEPKPEKETEIKVNPSGLVTFLLSANDIIYYYKGKFNGAIEKTDFTRIGSVIKKYYTEIDEKDLMFLIKADQKSSFKNAVDILDQMVLNKIPAGHYAEVNMTDTEIQSINNYKEN